MDAGPTSDYAVHPTWAKIRLLSAVISVLSLIPSFLWCKGIIEMNFGRVSEGSSDGSAPLSSHCLRDYQRPRLQFPLWSQAYGTLSFSGEDISLDFARPTGNSPSPGAYSSVRLGPISTSSLTSTALGRQFRSYGVRIQIWVFPILALSYPLARIICRLIRRSSGGRCGNCQYNLYGLESLKCPECGTPVPPSERGHLSLSDEHPTTPGT